jgi:hypothetical protein
MLNHPIAWHRHHRRRRTRNWVFIGRVASDILVVTAAIGVCFVLVYA